MMWFFSLASEASQPWLIFIFKETPRQRSSFSSFSFSNRKQRFNLNGNSGLCQVDVHQALQAGKRRMLSEVFIASENVCQNPPHLFQHVVPALTYVTLTQLDSVIHWLGITSHHKPTDNVEIVPGITAQNCQEVVLPHRKRCKTQRRCQTKQKDGAFSVCDSEMEKRQASRQEMGRRETLSHTWKLRLFACTTLSVDPGHVSFYIESSAGVQAYLLVRVDIEPVRVVEWQPQHAACQRQAVQLVKTKKKKRETWRRTLQTTRVIIDENYHVDILEKFRNDKPAEIISMKVVWVA